MTNKLFQIGVVIVVALAFFATFCSVKPKEGQFKCDNDDDCPSGWACNPDDEMCYSDESEFPSGPSGDSDTDTDADADADADTDTDTDADTDSDVCSPPYECMPPNACTNNDGISLDGYACETSWHVCCDLG